MHDDVASFDCAKGPDSASWEMKMKIVISALAIVIFVMIGAQNAYAISDYQSGFKHGVADGKLDSIVYCRTPTSPCPYPDNKYIQQPGKGFAYHTSQFVNGYIKGWCSVIGPHGGGGREANDDSYTPASFDCDRGPSSAYPSPRD